MSEFDTSTWPLYRSRIVAAAKRIAHRDLPLGAPVTVADKDGRVLQAKIGDVLVEPIGCALEVWPFDLFERELELAPEPPKPPAPIKQDGELIQVTGGGVR